MSSIQPEMAAYVERVFEICRETGRESADCVFLEMIIGREVSASTLAEIEAFARAEFEQGVAQYLPALGIEDTPEIRRLLADIAQREFVDRFGALRRAAIGAA